MLELIPEFNPLTDFHIYAAMTFVFSLILSIRSKDELDWFMYGLISTVAFGMLVAYILNAINLIGVVQ